MESVIKRAFMYICKTQFILSHHQHCKNRCAMSDLNLAESNGSWGVKDD